MNDHEEFRISGGQPSAARGEARPPVPRIRFKEFGGVWEADKLSRHLSVSEERNEDNRYGAADVFSVSREHGVVNQIEFQGRSFAGASLLGYRVIHKGQVAYTKSPLKAAPYGIVKADKTKSGIVSALYGVYDAIADADFVQTFFENDDRLNAYLRPLVNKGAKNTLLVSDEDALSGEVRFPSLPEQRRIAELFRNLDETIAATDARLEKLRQSKKSLLEKMFPRPGASVPEIRFKGFDGKWETKKLNEIADPISEKNVRLETREAFTNSAELGVVSQRDFFDFDVAKRLAGYLLIRPDDFVYNPRISILAPFGPINRNELGRVGAMSPLYFAFRSYGIVIDYLQVFFKTSCWHPFMRFNGDSGARSDRFSIRNDLFMQMPILAPKSKDEQQRIGSFFRELDKLIESVQKKAAKLRQVKSALLEEMFV